MKNMPQALKYLVWPGLMLVTAGCVVGLLNGWTMIAVAFLIAGLMLLVAGIAAGDYASSQFWGQRSLQSGTNAVVSVLSVLVILGLINFLGARYDARIDITEGQQLTLAPATREVVRNLQAPTEVLIFSPVPNPPDQQLLDNYRRINPDFSYRYLDPLADPQLAQEIGVKTGGEVFLRSGEGEAERTVLVQRLGNQEPLTERQLTDKLAQLSQENVAIAYFLQGHGEYAIDGSKAGYFEAATQLQAQNYTVAPLNLADTSTVPPDADVVIIAGPQEKLFENEVIALKDYLESGGSVFVMVDPNAETGLEVLMSQWGVVPEATVVIDTSGGGQIVGLGPAAPLVQDYGNHPITDAFGQGRSFFPFVRPLQIREIEGVKESSLLYTNQNSHAQPLTEGELSVDPNQAPEGPFVLGVALSRPVTESAAADSKVDDATAADSTDAAADETTDETADATVKEADGTENAAAEEDAAETRSAEEAIKDALPANELLGEASSEDSTEKTEARMVIIGNSTFATDGLFSQQLNGDLFLNSVSWLSKLDSPVLSIRPKEVTNRRFQMTLNQQLLITLVAVLLFPLAGLISAGVLWRVRR